MIHYNENQTDCYLLLLDASKAFDRVEYNQLFNRLRDRNMCPIVLRLLINMYINQKIQVKWNNVLSKQYSISNGVKQGGCLSPILFSIYLNDLIDVLRSSNIGCRYGNHYMGVYCYADDIGLLSPTLSGLKEMLKLCEDYALKHKIIFNASKSQLLYFPSNTARVPKDFMLKMKSGQVIPYTDTCNYLGNTICSHDENVIIDNAITDMNMRLNNLLSEFSHCDSGTLSTLFRTYCMNIYGCQTWRYNSNYLDKFYTTWRKAVRRVWKIPYRTHNKLVHLINKSCSINTVLEKRSIKFIWTLINSPNQLYNQIVKYSLYNYTTIIGENVRYFMNKYDISRDDWNSPINILYNKIDLYSTQHTLLDDICVATSIRELCESRDSEYTNFFDRNESRKLIDFLCTT